MRRRDVGVSPPRSSFAGFRFPPEVISVAVRWYLRYGLSYRNVEELLAERGVEVDQVTVYRWVQHFTPLLDDAAAPQAQSTLSALPPHGRGQAISDLFLTSTPERDLHRHCS